MRVREVVILREVADDLNGGKSFYDQNVLVQRELDSCYRLLNGS